MHAIRGDGGSRRSHEAAPGNVGLALEMEASDRALVAADEAEVHAAMDSVRWERRGVLRRLTRGQRG
jgi:hypothetical protein